MTLWELLERHAARHTAGQRLHLPAHRGGEGMPELRVVFGERYVAQDLTEVGELDDLAWPSGVLADTQAEIAHRYGMRKAYLLAQGSSQGLASALFAAVGPQDIVLLPQNCHRSAVAGLVASGARPVFYPVRWDRRFGVFTAPDLDAMETLLRTTGARAVVFVYPSYEGIAYDLRDAVARVHARGARAIVDAAHGSHFGLAGLPPHPATAGADAVVLGMHKSGGALTPGALLLSAEEDDRLEEGLRLFGTSSPSYPVLASVALAVHTLAVRGSDRVARSAAAAALLDGPAVLRPDLPHDPTRRLVRTASAPKLAEKLFRRFGVLPEYVGAEQILFLFGLDYDPEAARPWARAVSSLPAPDEPLAPPPLGEGVLSPRDALLAPRARVPILHAVGRVAASVLAASPPGVPFVWPGQRITEWVVESALAARAAGQTVLGLRDDLVAVVA